MGVLLFVFGVSLKSWWSNCYTLGEENDAVPAGGPQAVLGGGGYHVPSRTDLMGASARKWQGTLGLALASLAIMLSSAVFASDLYVNPTCGDDAWSGRNPNCVAPDGPKRSIQAAIDAAQPGETVVVLPGQYTGEGNCYLKFHGKAITLRGSDPNDPNIVAATIIGPTPYTTAFVFENHEGNDTLIDGLTIEGGSQGAAVIYCRGGFPTIQKCRVSNGYLSHSESGSIVARQCVFSRASIGSDYGHGAPMNARVEGCMFEQGGMYASGGETVISDCNVTNGSISCDGGTASIDNCSVAGGSIEFGGCSTVRVRQCVLNTGRIRLFGCPNATVSLSSIRGGRSGSDLWGGGVYSWNSNLTLTDCDIIENTTKLDGGGIACTGSGSTTLSNCRILRNTAEELYGIGSGIYCGDSQSLTLTQCRVEENASAGLHVQSNGTLTVADCSFVRNGSGCSVGGSANAVIRRSRFLANGGVGIACWDNMTISDCTIVGNVSIRGGGMQCRGANVTVSNCLIAGNVANGEDFSDAGGGGVWVAYSSQPRFQGCVIAGNMAAPADYRCGGGGGICAVYSSQPRFQSCLIAGNYTPYSGGGVLAKYSSTVRIENCTFGRNSVPFPDHGRSIACMGNSAAVIANSILWGDERSPSGEISLMERDGPSSLDVSYCDVRGGPNSVDAEPSCTLEWGPGNLDADPCFVGGPSGMWTADGVYDANAYQVVLTNSAATWAENELIGKLIQPDVSQPIQLPIVANTATTITIWACRAMIDAGASLVSSGAGYQIHDYHLLDGSPCINAGDPNAAFADYDGQTDIDGQPRYMIPRLEMGADEYPYTHHCGSGLGASLPSLTMGLVICCAMGRRWRRRRS